MSVKLPRVRVSRPPGRPRKIRLPKMTFESSTSVTSEQPSLPPAGAVAATPASPDALPLAVPPSTDASLVPAPPAPPAKRKFDWRRPPNSKVRKTALQIVALRLRGMSDEDIAPIVGLKNPRAITQYLWLAGKNGWLDDIEETSPKDRLDYSAMHKVVRNMERALDSEDPERADKMAVEIAKGTLFKSYDTAGAQQAPPLGALMINIQMPEGVPMQTIREGTTGGIPTVIDAEVVHGSEPTDQR